MQVKKFEAPTIQEALETIKRELGPEAIILQTKKNKRGFGLMSKASVEITAAISERSLQKKQFAERRIPDETRKAIQDLPAPKQADVYDKYMDRQDSRLNSSAGSHLDRGMAGAQDRVDMGMRGARIAAQPQASARGGAAAKPAAPKGITPRRYVDIDDGDDDQTIQQPSSGYGRSAGRVSTQAQQLQQSNAQSAARAQGTPLRGGAIAATQELETAQTRRSGGAQNFSAMPLEEEVHHLKRMIEEMRSSQQDQSFEGPAAGATGGPALTPALSDAFEQLVLNGMARRYAMDLIRKTAFELGEEKSLNPDYVLDQLAAELMRNVQVLSPLADLNARSNSGPEVGEPRGPMVIALVGPTGVGKTTTIAKMASEALLKRNLKVGLINLDSYKVAAFDQLSTYAKILNVPFRSAATADDLRIAVQDFQALDLVIIDTTGRSQRDPEALKEMQALLEAVPGLESHLILSATTRDTELYDMGNRFNVFRPRGLIISKLDEAAIFGSIYNVSHKLKLPLLSFTTGQRVPEDMEEASRERLVALIMDI